MSVLSDFLKDGKVPDVPVKVVVDNDSIFKLALAAIIVVAIILLLTKLLKRVN